MRRNFYLMACAVTVLTATLLVGVSQPVGSSEAPVILEAIKISN
jgi:hypothetical protein